MVGLNVKQRYRDHGSNFLSADDTRAMLRQSSEKPFSYHARFVTILRLHRVPMRLQTLVPCNVSIFIKDLLP